MLSFEASGSFNKTDSFLRKMSNNNIASILQSYGEQGVAALRAATPVDSSLTSESWDFQVSSSSGGYAIEWTNSNTRDGLPIAILLQYGHGTGTGGYVQGRDYINPAMKPVFDKIADGVWKAVASA